MGCKRLIAVVVGLSMFGQVFFVLGSPASLSDRLPRYPRAELVKSSDSQETATHEIILGTVKKRGGIDRPDASRFVVGRRIATTWFIPDEQRTDVVGDFYRERMEALGEILFECKGYGCGSSNYWANSVFGRSILYGPAQYQHYFLTEIVSDTTYYVATYVALRGTREIYVHLDVVVEKASTTIDGARIVAALESKGRFVIDAGDETAAITPIIEAMQIKPLMRVAIVRHGERQQGESVEAAIERTGTVASEFVRQLVAEGVNETRIEAFGVGPLAPVGRDLVDRTEIVLLSTD